MDTLIATMIAVIAAPITVVFSPSTRIFGLYLAGAAILAVLVYYRERKARSRQRDPPANGAFLRWCVPGQIYTHASARLDYRFYALSMMLYGAGLVPIAITAPALARWTNDALITVLGATAAAPGEPQMGIGALYTLSVLIAFDAGTWLAHLLQHKVATLWEFHKVHHSAQVLTPITAYRMHPVDIMVSGTVAGATTGVMGGAFAWANAAAVDETLVLGLNAGLFAFYLLGFNLRHSHIWLAYPTWLSWVLISPAQHQIHHSQAPRHFDMNLGFVFSMWDRMAGTLYVPRTREAIQYGIGNGEDEDYESVTALYCVPFRKAGARWAKRMRSLRARPEP